MIATPSRTPVFAVLLTAFVAFGAGCSGARSALETLEEALHFYHCHVQGGDVERASAYVAIEAMDKFMALHDPERNLYVMEDFSVKQVSGDPSDGKMEVRMTAQARKRNSITIETIRYREVWERREGRWMMIDEEALMPGQGRFPAIESPQDDF